MNTALHIAVTNGHMAIAKLFVEADPSDKHVRDASGDTPVYLAAKLGYNDIVKMICTTCRAPSLGTTALHAAIIKLPQESVLRLLRDDQHLVTYGDSSRGWTPLQYAAHYAFDSVLDVIVQAQRDVGYQFVSPEKRTPLYVDRHISAVIRLMQLLPGTCADGANTQIIVTALITTVTFTVGLTMPGGYHQSGELIEDRCFFPKRQFLMHLWYRMH